MTSPWTIIGFYSDSGETCSEVVHAYDAKEAAEEAYRLAKESGGDDFRLISVIAGDHPEALGLPEPMAAAEFELWKNEDHDQD